jgi:Zn-dependent protease
MRWSYRIFTVNGISVELHTTFILFALLILTFGGLQSLLLLFLIFAIVLAHELMHSLTAVLHGIKVPRIILTPIGGLASIELPDDPLLELKVSIVGPLFNFAIAGIGMLLLFALSESVDLTSMMYNIILGEGELTSMSGVLLMLVSINLMLGAFNMLPAFPMDGGRVFRSVLALWMDHEKATRVAGFVGQLIFVSLAVWGIFSSNIWLVLIGIFLWYAGGSEVNFVRFRTMFADVKLRDIASPSLVYVNETLSWEDFLQTVYRRAFSIYLVVDGAGVMKKVITLQAVGEVDLKKPIGEAPGVEYVVVEGSLKAADALKIVLTKKLVLVAEDGKIIGYVTAQTLGDSAAYLNLANNAGLNAMHS